MQQLYKELDPILLPNKFSLKQDEKLPRPLPHVCPFPQIYRCNSADIYRSHDGSCNNLRNPMWGRMTQPFGRFLAADYADGKQYVLPSLYFLL